MTRRSYSVLVDPGRSSDSVEELAQRLGPLTRQSIDQLELALARGPVTFETDLERSEAERVCRRLQRRSAPAEIRDGSGETVEVFAPEGEDSPRAEASSSDSDATDAAPEDEAEPVETWSALLDDASAAGESETEPSEEAVAEDRQSAPFESATSEGTDEGEAVLEFRPSRDPASGESEETDSPPEKPSRESELPQFDLELGAEADDAAGDDPGRLQEGAERAERAETESLETDDDAPSDGAFDASRMTEALADGASGGGTTGERPSFQKGPAHIPLLAALLSALAPGAGQIYNGESDRGWSYTTRALLIVPWIESVRDALERARSIRGGEVERPPSGSLIDALTHVAILWGATAGVGIAVWIAAGFFDGGDVSTPEAKPTRAERIGRARRAANVEVHEARLAAWERAGHQEVDDRRRYTMSRRQRALRLYRIGHRHCRAREYGMCESVMGKVAKLDAVLRRSAYRLQAWASVQRQKGRPGAEFPEVRPPPALDAGLAPEVASPPDATTLTGPDAGEPDASQSTARRDSGDR